MSQPAKRVNHVRFVNRHKANAPGVQPGTPNKEPALSLFVRALYDAIVTVAFERDTVFCLLLNIHTHHSAERNNSIDRSCSGVGLLEKELPG